MSLRTLGGETENVSAGIKAKSNGRTRRVENVCQKSVFVRDGAKWREMKSWEIGSEIERAERSCCRTVRSGKKRRRKKSEKTLPPTPHPSTPHSTPHNPAREAQSLKSDFICRDLTCRTIIRRLLDASLAAGPAPLCHGGRRASPLREAFQHVRFSLIRNNESAQKRARWPSSLKPSEETDASDWPA